MSPSRKAPSAPSRRAISPRRSQRSGNYRRVVTAGDVALGLGLAVTRPARDVTSQAVRTAERFSKAFGTALFESLPQDQQSLLREQTDDLARSGRQARVESVDAMIGIIVAETMSSDVVRTAMVSAASQAMDEVVDASMPSVVEQLRTEIATVRLEEMVRASVERVVPEVIEQDLSNAIMAAAGLPGRTARSLARFPSSVRRPNVADQGYDE